jgi:SMI1-KNR4 cell-wall
MQKLRNENIAEIERSLGTRLPGLYRKLLVEIGFGRYGQKDDCKWNTTRELYHPSAVRDLYTDFFDDPHVLFSPYFPFGCNNETQDLWIIDAAAEKAASIPHDTHPDDWPEMEWLTYETWIERFFDDRPRPIQE